MTIKQENEIKKLEARDNAIVYTSIVLAEDLWSECKAKGWDSGDLWNKEICPHSEDDFVKVKRLISIIDGERIISVEKVTLEMIERALGSQKSESKSEVKE